jgi:iron complex outermembrane receptor protein
MMKNRKSSPIALWVALMTALPSLPYLAAQEDDPTPEPEAVEQSDQEFVVTDEILVLDEWPPPSGVQILQRDDLAPVPIGDGADLLRRIAGVSVGRMGGHGLEPRIRGLGESSLNVLLDGAYVHGGCPNRMDPPSSFAAPNGFDRITVLKGVQSLRYGAGGSGGTLLFERSPTVLPVDQPWRADVRSAYGSWHRNPEVGVDAAFGRGSFYLRALGEMRSFDSYEDGDGNTVRSAYDSLNGSLIIGFGKQEKGVLELGLESTRTDDALFAGAGMDSPEDSNDTVRLKLRRGNKLGGWSDLRADLYFSAVDHLMDNYSLRPLSAPMAMRVPSTSDTFGGRLSADRERAGRLRLTLGIDYQENVREALRYAGPHPERVTNLQSAMWPDTALAQGGLFVEGERLLGSESRLRFAGRIDRFTATAAKADLQPLGVNRSPNELYDLYYGSRAEDWSDTDASALLRYERRLRSRLTLFTGLSRSLRPADATERYLGSDNPSEPKRWVGNPRLEPSKHHQLDLGVAATGKRSYWALTGFTDQVEDFILRDRAHGQEGICQGDSASIYRNAEARLIGLELEGRQSLGSRFDLSGTAGWVRGDNREDDRPLAQIPPLQGRLGLRYDDDRWAGTLGLRWATRQTRVDDDPRTGSGLDFGETSGYAVLDLSGSFEISAELAVVAGADNLLDHTYSDHLNRGNLFDPDPIRVNEPGRSLWVRLRWQGGAVQ